jgi:nitroreductase
MPEPSPLQAVLESRRSIRRFRPDPVEKDKILSCLEAARVAPSAENAQTWRFLVIDDPEVKDRFAEAVFSGLYRPTRFAAQAPVLVLLMSRLDILANRLGRGVQGIPFHLLDMGIAGEHFVLRAEELGLGTCWIGWFAPRAARRFFRIPRAYRMIGLLAVGYPASRPPRPRVRKPLDEIAWFNRFRG